jgi:hypothetical protein
MRKLTISDWRFLIADLASEDTSTKSEIQNLQSEIALPKTVTPA